MLIAYIADHPRLIPVVAGWKYREWGRLYPLTLAQRLRPWHTPEGWVESTRAHAGLRAIPTVFVALLAGRPAGTAALVAHDDSEGPAENACRAHFTPWLSGVYVAPPFRRRGIGAALVQRVVEEASALGIPRLYLQTFDRAAYYERLGWSQIEDGRFQGRPVVIMVKKLG